MSTPDDDLPDPEIEIIRNRGAHAAWLAAHNAKGGLLILDGPGVRANAVDLSVISQVLDHFDRLVRIVRADRSGLEVRRSGRIRDVVGAFRLVAVPAVPGSFAVPLRLEAPEGSMVGVDHGELDAVVRLMGLPEKALEGELTAMPERVGDEIVSMLYTIAQSEVTLHAEALDGARVTAEATVDVYAARRRYQRFVDVQQSETGFDTLAGTLFRIDTRRGKIAVDVSGEDDEGVVIAEAQFNIDMLETLRAALHRDVEVDVSVVEERRRYERTARSRSLSVLAVRVLDL